MNAIGQQYPPRLSVEELRHQLDIYLHERRAGRSRNFVRADDIRIRQFLTWLDEHEL
jgi:hypothetical protein